MPRATPKKKEPRVTKSLRQRATEALDAAQRKVDRLTAHKDKLAGELRGVEAELDAATVRRDFLASDPELAEAEPEGAEEAAAGE
jgi:hypothetical protein